MTRTSGVRAVLAMLPTFLLFLASACGGGSGSSTSSLPAAPTVVATAAAFITPVSPSTPSVLASTPLVAPTTSGPTTTPIVPSTPSALTTPTAGTPTASTTAAVFSCPAGWSTQDVPARRYRFCMPPGWTATLASAAGSNATPVPSTASLGSEPVGSLVHVASPEQGQSLTPGAVATGTLINIYVTTTQVTAAFPNTTAFPICAGAAASVGSHITSLCNLDNTSAATNPYRMVQWSSRPDNPSVYVQGFTGKDVSSQDQLLVQQVVGTIRFY